MSPWGSRRSQHLCLQLLNSNVVNDLMLLESLLDNLAARQKDPCASVRRLVLRGLANITSGSPDKVSQPASRPLWSPEMDSRTVVGPTGRCRGAGMCMASLQGGGLGHSVKEQAPGLGDLGTQLSAGCPQVQTHGPQLLTAMISGLDDGDDPHSLVALEAMAGLAKLLGLVEPGDLRPVLLHTAIRIRPFFDSVGWAGTGVGWGGVG